jgi:serine/threonine-protein kinase
MAGPRIVAGKYALGTSLGRGGMGDVYEATELATGRVVALKIMRAPTEKEGDLEQKWTVRFEREVRTVRELHSPHIVELIDDGSDPETNERFLVMERLRGEDLGSLLHRLGPLPVDLAVRIAAQICLGLECAHGARVVHRDIKPGNLFLSTSAHGHGAREMRILDFGIARVGVGAEAVDITELTQTGSMVGSPHYMAPEQARSSKDVDGRADLWSLGVVLYRLLTGVLPHQEADSGLGELLIAVCCRPATSIQERAPWVPTELARIIHRALSIERNDRFRDAREMYDALVALLPDKSYAIDETMLVPLRESARLTVAPRAELSTPRGMSFADTKTQLVTSATPSRAAGTKSRLLTRGGFAFLLALGATSIVLRYVNPHRAKLADETPVTVVQPLPEPDLPPAAPMATVSLRVPPGFRVVVDGAAVAVVDDQINLSGVLGSTHSVTILSDTEGERFETVVISAGGAVPSSIAPPPRRVVEPARAPTPAIARVPKSNANGGVGASTQGLRTTFE